MFAFCTKRFHMSEAVAARRIRAGRATCRFPCILGMVARGELHLSGIHQLAGHLTEENGEEVLRRARHRSMREVERLVAEISPKPDVPSSIRALPTRRVRAPSESPRESRAEETLKKDTPIERLSAQHSAPPAGREVTRTRTQRSLATPLSPRRYKLQVTIGQEARDKLSELQDLLSHQIPDGDPASVVERALDALLTETKKKRAAITDKPRATRKKSSKRGRGIPAQVRREVFERDEGRCAFTDSEGRRCSSRWQVEFHHRVAYARGGTHDVENIELRCRAHNQYEAEVEYGVGFMALRRGSGEAHLRSG
jgi:hypothetical protein